MITDAAAIALALLALWVAGRPSSVERTFGYHRTQVIAAMLNALSIWLIAAYILFEAYHRIWEAPDVEGGLILVVGAIGLAVNIAAAFVLYRSARHSLNVQGAFLHVIADLIGSVGVVISGVIIVTTGWTLVDPILSILLGLLIMASAWRLVVKVFNVLLEGVPEHIDVYALCAAMEDLSGVTVIHDVHVWTISSGYHVMTAHVLVDPEHAVEDLDGLMRRLREIAMKKYGIRHVTIQLEQNVKGCTELDHVDHLMALKRGPVRKLLPF
jgi:cobalt-zinc-cadmium efflux system protein